MKRREFRRPWGDGLNMKAAAGLMALAFSLSCACAQEAPPQPGQPIDAAQPTATPAPTPQPAATPPALIPALTVVRVKIMVTINSAVNKIGEHFPIQLDAPIQLTDGREVPAGIMGSGDVVHAAKSRFGGKAGELILAARYLDWNGVRIPLRSLTFFDPRQGKDNVGAATATAIIVSPVLALFITGGEVNIPEGTTAYAKTSAPVTEAPASNVANEAASSAPTPPPAPTPAPPTNASPTEKTNNNTP